MTGGLPAGFRRRNPMALSDALASLTVCLMSTCRTARLMPATRT